MPSRLETNKNNFEIIYEAPWGGINVDDYEGNIQPGQFAKMQGFNIKLNRLVTSGIYGIDPAKIDFTNPGGFAWQYMFYIANSLVLIDTSGGVYSYFSTLTLIGSLGYANPVINTGQLINGTYYAFDFNNCKQIVITFPFTITVLTPYAAGKYTMVLNNYLIQAYTNQPSDTPAVKPGRVNWSSPNAYTTFDPTVDRTAGYNVLGDVSDEIQGMFVQGNVGYIIRTQGITQVSPTGDPLGPFAFTTFLSGDFGMGTSYPDSISTFGYLTMFFSNSGIYMFQGGAITDVSYNIKSLYQNLDIVSSGEVPAFSSWATGVLYGSSYGDSYDSIKYALIITVPIEGTANYTRYLFILDVHAKNWVFSDVSYLGGGKLFRNFMIHATEVVGGVNFPINYFMPYYLANDNTQAPVSTIFDSSLDGASIAFGTPTAKNLTFKLEEFKLGRTVSMRRILIKAQGVGTLHVSFTNFSDIGNTSVGFTDIVVNDASRVKIYTSSGMCTIQGLQLNINSTNFQGQIVKVMVAGTYADGDLI